MSRDSPPRKAYTASYPARVPVPGTNPTQFLDLRCFRGHTAEVEALVASALATNPGAKVRYEDRQTALGQLYIEIVLPQEVSP